MNSIVARLIALTALVIGSTGLALSESASAPLSVDLAQLSAIVGGDGGDVSEIPGLKARCEKVGSCTDYFNNNNLCGKDWESESPCPAQGSCPSPNEKCKKGDVVQKYYTCGRFDPSKDCDPFAVEDIDCGKVEEGKCKIFVTDHKNGSYTCTAAKCVDADGTNNTIPCKRPKGCRK